MTGEMPFQTAKKPQDQPFHLQRIGRRDILKVEVGWIGCINPIKPQRMCRIYTFKFQKIKNAKRLKDRLHQKSKSLLDNQYNFQTLEKWLLAIWIWTMDPFRVWRSRRSSNMDGLWVKELFCRIIRIRYIPKKRFFISGENEDSTVYF